MSKDITRLRELAKQVREIAEDPVQERNKKLWTAVNDKKMIQPVAMTRDYGLDLVKYEDELKCQVEDEELRYHEIRLLALIYQWKHLRCHTVTEKWIPCNAVTEETSCGIPDYSVYEPEEWWRLKKTTYALVVQDEENPSVEKIYAKHFDPVFKGMDDLKKIVPIEIKYDKEATKKKVDRLNEIFDDILLVYPRGRPCLACCPYDAMLRVVGIEETMLALMDNPEFVKAFAERYIDLYIGHQKKLEELGLINYTNGSTLAGRGGYGFTSLLPQAAPGKGIMGAKTKETWGVIADQILTSVSPEMSQEFGFDMEKPFAEMFGLVYYGCCERLDHKIDGVLSLPNIHKISCSAFSKTEEFFEKVGDKAVVSVKLKSMRLAHPTWDKEAVRQELVDLCSYARKYNCNFEVNMKNIINIGKGPYRLWDWCEIAVEVLDNY
jgi:hypothetical protein